MIILNKGGHAISDSSGTRHLRDLPLLKELCHAAASGLRLEGGCQGGRASLGLRRAAGYSLTAVRTPYCGQS